MLCLKAEFRLVAILLLVAMCLHLGEASLRADDGISVEQSTAGTAFSEDQLQALTSRLNSSIFRERVAARRELAQAVKADPYAMGQLAVNSELHIGAEIVQALKQLFLKEDNEQGERAEQVLMAISATRGEVGSLAKSVLVTYTKLRENRAQREIIKLGGEFTHFSPATSRLTTNQIARSLIDGDNNTMTPVVRMIWLHDDWRGTPEDLWHVQRFENHHDLLIYSVRGNSIASADLLRLASVLPGLTIAERGPCLGIRNDAFFAPEDCIVGSILKGSSAEKYGLKPGDVITHLDDKEIQNFQHLVRELQAYGLGDRIKLHLNRKQSEMDLELVLGSWRGISQHDKDAVAAPVEFQGPYGPILQSPRPPAVPRPRKWLQVRYQ